MDSFMMLMWMWKKNILRQKKESRNVALADRGGGLNVQLSCISCHCTISLSSAKYVD